MVRLELLKLNTMGALDPARLADARALAPLTASQLRAFGRLPHPMLRRAGEPGFSAISWDEALDLAGRHLRAAPPDRIAFYLTSRGIPNETYYAAQKAARFLGTNHVDNAARLCHAASTVAMKDSVGYGASTASYRDWLDADLIVFFGANTPNNQPVTTKYLYEAKRRGVEIAVVNPLREPGFERYWVPSAPESALFGTKLASRWFTVDTGGDLAFLNGALKALLEIPNGVDQAFVARSTKGFLETAAAVRSQSWSDLAASSGASEESMRSFAALLLEKPRAHFVWSMGLTQHAHGVETIRALMNLGLARGLPGRAGCGLTPIRGHSGVQGGAEVGCIPNLPAETLERWESVWGFPVPRTPGYTTVRQIEASARGEVDVFWILGGNFLETLPDKDRSLRALQRPRLRVHQDIVLSPGMLVEAGGGDVLLLPAATRYETPGGVTETTTERRIVFSPEIPGRRIGSARPEWEVLFEAAARARPEHAASIRCASLQGMRDEIARAIPLYAGIESLSKQGDAIQWGGERLYADGRFATPDGKAHFSAVQLPLRARQKKARELRVSTRRGKQFNSIVHRDTDPLTGAGRHDVLMSAEDAETLRLSEHERVRVRSSAGEFRGHVRVAPIQPGNLQVHWPEGNPLLTNDLDEQSGEPDYNACVTVEKEEA
jgi:molybdopterin-dependent oxidoreductase alpha subunit